MRIHHLLAVVLVVSAAYAGAGETKLPAPQKTGGTAILAAIDQRASAAGNSFPSGALSEQDYSTILWAATGNNRGGSKWTVPMGMGMPPYVRVYLVRQDGSFYYDWEKGALVSVSDQDNRAAIAMQDFVKKAPAQLIFAIDNQALSKVPNPVFASEFGLVLVGAMTQNVYLAAQAVGAGTRVIYSINRDVAADLLQFPKDMVAICSMPVGK